MSAFIRSRWVSISVPALAAVLLAVPACGSAPRVASAPHPAAGTGEPLVTSPHSALYVVPPPGGPARPLLNPAEAARLGSVSDPAWSPGGRQIAFTAGCASCPAKLYVVSRSGSGLRRIPTGPGSVSSPGWSPDGHSLVFARNQGEDQFLCSVDIRTGALRLVHSEPSGVDNTDDAPSWSPGGHWIAFAREIHHEQENLWEVPAAGGPARRLTGPQPSQQARPRWSPDGRQIVFMQVMPPRFTWDLFILSIGPGLSRRLTASAASEYDPAWSPDGRYVVFASDAGRRTGFRSLYVIGTDGTGLRRLTAGPADDSMPSWSPAGTEIVFVRRPSLRV
jgi:TolB protein